MNPSDLRLLKEAAQWLARLESGAPRDRVLVDIEAWCQLSPGHRKAWQAAAEFHEDLSALPLLPEASAEILERAQRLRGRRRTLGALAVAGITVPTAAVLSGIVPGRDWLADYRTAKGEQRSLQVWDGVDVELNTASAMDVSNDQGELRLRSGEAFITRAGNSATRRIVVKTKDAVVELLGARANVRVTAQGTRAAALSGDVMVHAMGSGLGQRLTEGRAGLIRQEVLQISQASPNDELWRKGLIYASETPLPEFIESLSRYQSGFIRCDPLLAEVRVSGVYRHKDVDGVLSFIAQTYPVRIRRIPPLLTMIERA